MKRLLIPVFLFGIATLFLLSCQKELSQESNINTASFSLLNDSTLQCLDSVAVNGDYYNGVAARDVNFITVVVNVKTTGNYSIASIDKNGFHFADSGFFSRVGMDTLLLKMTGRPILPQLTEFTFGDTTCPFSVDVRDSTGTGLGGVDTSGTETGGDSSYIDPTPAATNTWHFTDTATGITYNGIFSSLEGAGFRNDTLFVAGQALTIDTLFGVTLKIPSLTIAPGIYPVNAANSIALQTAIDQNDFYVANNVTASEGEGNSYITITSYSNNQLAGSFHAYAEFNGVPTLIEGSFDCTVH